MQSIYVQVSTVNCLVRNVNFSQHHSKDFPIILYLTNNEMHSIQAVYNHWTGLVNWTGGLTLKIIFTPSMRLTCL